MNIFLISLIMVFIVAAGLVTISATGFFSATGDSGQDAAAGDTGPAFRLSFGPDGSDDTTPEDEVPANEDENTIVIPPVTGAVTGGGSSGGSSGGGSSGGDSSSTPETPCTPATCDALGYECGSWDDGCGGTLDCTTCGEGFACSSGTCIEEILAYITVYPETSVVSIDDSFTVDVKIDTNAMVYAADVKVEFNNDILQVTQVMEGNFLDSIGGLNPPIKFDNDDGTIKYLNTRIAPQEGKEGKGIFISMDFNATALGLSEIIVTAQVVDFDTEDVETVITNGEVTVNE